MPFCWYGAVLKKKSSKKSKVHVFILSWCTKQKFSVLTLIWVGPPVGFPLITQKR